MSCPTTNVPSASTTRPRPAAPTRVDEAGDRRGDRARWLATRSVVSAPAPSACQAIPLDLPVVGVPARRQAAADGVITTDRSTARRCALARAGLTRPRARLNVETRPGPRPRCGSSARVGGGALGGAGLGERAIRVRSRDAATRHRHRRDHRDRRQRGRDHHQRRAVAADGTAQALAAQWWADASRPATKRAGSAAIALNAGVARRRIVGERGVDDGRESRSTPARSRRSAAADDPRLPRPAGRRLALVRPDGR